MIRLTNELEMIVQCPQCQASIWASSYCSENVFNLYVFSCVFNGIEKDLSHGNVEDGEYQSAQYGDYCNCTSKRWRGNLVQWQWEVREAKRIQWTFLE